MLHTNARLVLHWPAIPALDDRHEWGCLMAEERNDAGGGPLRGVSQTDAMFKVLRESVDSNVVTLIEHLVRDAPDHSSLASMS
jgi:hypothetical protein